MTILMHTRPNLKASWCANLLKYDAARFLLLQSENLQWTVIKYTFAM